MYYLFYCHTGAASYLRETGEVEQGGAETTQRLIREVATQNIDSDHFNKSVAKTNVL